MSWDKAPPTQAELAATRDVKMAATAPAQKAARWDAEPPPPDMAQADGLVDVARQDDEPNWIESLLRGGAQGATFGHADEIAGLAGALGIDDSAPKNLSFWDRYKANRDESRGLHKAAEEANPVASFAGNAIAGVGMAAIPGLGLAGAAAKGVSTAERAAQLAKLGLATGALSGEGNSTADSLGGLAKDAAVGGAMGGLMGGATPYAIEKPLEAAGSGLKGLGSLLKESRIGQNTARGWNRGIEGLGISGESAQNLYAQRGIDAVDNAYQQTKDLARFPKASKDLKIGAAESAGQKVELMPAINQTEEEFKKQGKLPSDIERALGMAKQGVVQNIEQPNVTFRQVEDMDGNILSRTGTNRTKGDQVAEAVENIEPPTGPVLRSSTSAREVTDPQDGSMYIDRFVKQITQAQGPTSQAVNLRPLEAQSLVERLQSQAMQGENSDIGPMLKKIAHNVKSANEQQLNVTGENKAVHRAMNAMKTIANSDDLPAQVPVSGVDILDRFASQNGSSRNSASDRLLNQRFEQSLAENVNPDFAKKVVGSYTEAAKDKALVKQISADTSMSSPLAQALPGPLAYAGPLLGSIKHIIPLGANYLGKRLGPPKTWGASQLASAAQALETQGQSKLAGLLKTAVNSNQQRRAALMFSIQQNPEYRDAITKLSGESDEPVPE